jgi:hypothetical protein
LSAIPETVKYQHTYLTKASEVFVFDLMKGWNSGRNSRIREKGGAETIFQIKRNMVLLSGREEGAAADGR